MRKNERNRIPNLSQIIFHSNFRSGRSLYSKSQSISLVQCAHAFRIAYITTNEFLPTKCTTIIHTTYTYLPVINISYNSNDVYASGCGADFPLKNPPSTFCRTFVMNRPWRRVLVDKNDFLALLRSKASQRLEKGLKRERERERERENVTAQVDTFRIVSSWCTACTDERVATRGWKEAAGRWTDATAITVQRNGSQ